MTAQPAPRVPQTCLYFGTFNPIHAGHLMIAQNALQQFGRELGFTTISFIPAGNPPHRATEEDLLDARRRYRMVRLATKDNPAFQVWDVEVVRQGLSYTVDTVRHLLEQGLVQAPVPLIIGADALQGLASWHQPVQLADQVLFLQAPRPDSTMVQAIQCGSETIALNTRAIDMPSLAISSSWVRQMVRKIYQESADAGAGIGSLRYYLPEPVRLFIQANRLYC
jgi:nicotinate-nucleotide adenylyltransferase